MTPGRFSTERWSRLSQLLDEALDGSSEDRARLLGRLERSEPDVAFDLRQLLEALDHSEGLLEKPVSLLEAGLEQREESPEDGNMNVPDQRIGPYRLIEEIGRGGMGAVYLAERSDGQFEHRVALKRVEQGFHSPEVRSRFLRERQILARLEHPHIARLLEGGVSEDDAPYFVMEYVEGETITKDCDARSIGVEGRLRLFLDVCSAVQYAHRQLVVHRDLKPSNILVDRNGVVKLLDFGIARLLEKDAASEQLTRTGHVPMTPEYAAPEQIRGAPASTSTDVYALGVVLYELLTGIRPYRVSGESLLMIQKAVLETEPEVPSRIVQNASEAARARDTTPGRLSRRLRGDLDSIVLMALRKEPERRYLSVDAFRQDIEHHLEGRPVAARPESWRYRLAKLVRRHRLGVAAVALIALSIGAGIAATLWQSARVSREAAKAEEVTDFLVSIFRTNDPLESRGDPVTARELLDRGAARIDEELSNQPEVRAHLMGVVGSLYRDIGDWERAKPILRRALEEKRALYGNEHLEVATALADWSLALWDSGDYDGARASMEEALAMRRKLRGANHPEVAELLNGLASVLTDLGEYSESEKLHREALAIDRAHYGEEHTVVARDLGEIALSVWRQSRAEEAEELARAALAMHRKLLGGDHPETISSMATLAAVLSRAGRIEEADELFEQVVAGRRKFYGGEHARLADTLSNQALNLERGGRLSKARETAREAMEIRRKVLGQDHPDLALGLNNLGTLAFRLLDYDEAERYVREAIDLWTIHLGEEHPHVVTAVNNLGVIQRERGDLASAESTIRRALALRRKILKEGHPEIAQSLRNLGVVLTDRASYDEADAALRAALDLSRASYDPSHWRIGEVLTAYGRLELERGRPSRAEPLLGEAFSLLVEGRGEDHPLSAEAKIYLGACYTLLRRFDEAETLLRAALHTRETIYGPDAWPSEEARLYLSEVLAATDRTNRAGALFSSSIAKLEQVRGPDHPLCGRAKTILAPRAAEAALAVGRD